MFSYDGGIFENYHRIVVSRVRLLACDRTVSEEKIMQNVRHAKNARARGRTEKRENNYFKTRPPDSRQFAS